jgi:hypothetical protein
METDKGCDIDIKLIDKNSYSKSEIEYQINLAEMDVEHFGREFFMLEPELLDNISKN